MEFCIRNRKSLRSALIALLAAGPLWSDVQAATAANAYVTVSSSTYGVEDIVPVGADFYVTTRNVSNSSFRANIAVTANSPYYLVKPQSGRMNLGIGESNGYRVRDESGNEDEFSGRVYVLKLDIEPTETNVCWKSTSCTLKLTDDSYPGGTAEWTSSPTGISGGGNSITFSPNALTTGVYTVTAKSGIVASYTDTCIVRVFTVEFITPDGDPVNAPVDSGDGQNEFTFSAARTGVLTMQLKAKVIPASAASAITGCQFNVGDIGSSVKKWATNNPNGKPTVSGSDLTATVTFTGLPEHNSDFGKKTATVSCGGMLCDTKDYEVFFPKTATNHPGGQTNSPNWYHYWSQTQANKANTTMTYLNAARSFYAYVSNRTIYVANDAALTQIPVWGSPKGIDCFAWTTAHEAKHHTQAIYFWPSNWVAADDTDRDWLPNAQEATYMPGRPYLPSNPATYPDVFGYGQNPIRDCEDIDMRSQNSPYGLDILWNNGSADAEDWANPGKQSCNSY